VDVPEISTVDSKRLLNAPSHFGSIRGIAPLGSPDTTLAARATLEAPRRIDLNSEDTTDTAVVFDVVASGRTRDLGLGWAVGVYNLFDWQYGVPVTETFASRRMPQQGRSFLAHLSLEI
jgi:hypothetical protein